MSRTDGASWSHFLRASLTDTIHSFELKLICKAGKNFHFCSKVWEIMLGENSTLLTYYNIHELYEN